MGKMSEREECLNRRRRAAEGGISVTTGCTITLTYQLPGRSKNQSNVLP
jgi:hypothetical protein